MSNKPKKKSDLLNILKDSLVNGLIDNDSLKMIEGVFKVSEIQVREIMIPRPHMIVLDISDNVDAVIKKVVSSGHSRFPVIDGNRDEIIGVLLAKDLLKISTNEEPTTGSPPIPTQVDWPNPISVVWATASYVSVPDLETIPHEPFL